MFQRTVLLFIALSSTQARNSHFYRRDYTYFAEFDAFYKLHWHKNGVSYNTAFTTCNDEGAKLFYPEEEGEWEVVKNLTAGFEELESKDVIVGVHDEIGRGEFVTVDGSVTPTPVIGGPVPAGHRCIAMDMDQIIYKTSTCKTDPPTKFLFVCKKVDENKRPCPTIHMSYEYKEETKKCYKVHNHTRNWQDAWHTCYMEGGMLLSIESNIKAGIIENMIKNKNTNYFVGFRKIFPGSEFYTVKGKRLQESGFEHWDDDIKNRENDHENLTMCGAIYLKDYWGTTLYMASEDCHNYRSFICEMAVRRTNRKR